MPDIASSLHMARLAESLRAVADYAATLGAPGPGAAHADNTAVHNWCLAEAAKLDTDHAANVEVGRQLLRLAAASDEFEDQDMFTLGALARYLTYKATWHPEQLLGKDQGPTEEYDPAELRTAPARKTEHDDGSQP